MAVRNKEFGLKSCQLGGERGLISMIRECTGMSDSIGVQSSCEE